ncbi:hypothetical protein LXL04_038365 [Taraxacum kok-saghyz]
MQQIFLRRHFQLQSLESMCMVSECDIEGKFSLINASTEVDLSTYGIAISSGMRMKLSSTVASSPSPTRNKKSENHGSVTARILMRNRNLLIEGHSGDIRKLASTICALVPRLMTGKTCLKSPPKTSIFPPNGRLLPDMSCIVRSSASIACRLAIEASSHMITFASRRILNLERAVLPPGMLFAATPEVAVAIAIKPRARILANNALYKKVFLVPPGPSTKNTPGICPSTCVMI